MRAMRLAAWIGWGAVTMLATTDRAGAETSRQAPNQTQEAKRAAPKRVYSRGSPTWIFADPIPNETKTIIAGADLVAVDWVGAAKMGLDPKISTYMDLAVRTFGKPEIDLVGDANPYRPWLNVPMMLSLFAHFGLDANHYFGNLLYSSGCYMDTNHFTFMSQSKFMLAAREALSPLKKAIFVQPEREKSFAAVLLSKYLTWLGR